MSIHSTLLQPITLSENIIIQSKQKTVRNVVFWLTDISRHVRLMSFVLLWLISMLTIGLGGTAQGSDFATWRAELRSEALSKGISESIFDTAFINVAPIARVIELDRNQPEFTLTLATYLQKVVTATRASKARQLRETHKEILSEVSNKYGVQSRFILALWGIETNFGQHTGGFSVIAALATLAHDGRRSDYFRKELLNALKILEEGHIKSANMKGSWAGAMGQSQFMPSSFLHYATDWNGDGRRDIWTSQDDVFASIANYLSSVGWRNDITWGREVKLPASFDGDALSEAKTTKSMDEWRDLGITSVDGSSLPNRNLISRLVIPAKSGGRAFLAYKNYDNILKWNRSNYFAIAVGTLADRIGAQ